MKDEKVARLENDALLKHGKVARLETDALLKDGKVARLENAALLKDGKVARLENDILLKDEKIAHLKQQNSWKDDIIQYAILLKDKCLLSLEGKTLELTEQLTQIVELKDLGDNVTRWCDKNGNLRALCKGSREGANFHAENRAVDEEKLTQNVQLKDLDYDNLTAWFAKNGNSRTLC